MRENQKLLQEEQFSKEDIHNAALIIHPAFEWYNLKSDEIYALFEEGSNFTTLENPIIDEFWNEFRDSEGFYMAQRTKDVEIKKAIAFMSTWYWLSRKARKLFDLEQDEEKRIEYMRNAIQQKFDNNPKLKQKLLSTWEKEIIEYTFWDDTFFWINQDTLRWKSILWKLLMEYRDKNLIK